MHLRTKLVIALLGLALVPCLVLGVFSYATSSGVVRAKVDGLTDADLARLARSVEAVMEQVNLSLLWFSTNETFVGLLSKLDTAHADRKPGETYETSLKLDRMLGGFFPLVLTIDAVGWASAGGARYGMSAYPADVDAVAVSPAFGAFAEAGAAVSWIGPAADPSPFRRGERAFVAGRQLRDTAYGAGTAPLGVLLFWISDRIFGDLVDSGTGSDGSRAPTMICDAGGVPVAGDGSAALAGLPGSPAWARISAETGGPFTADLAGGRYTVFHRSLRFAGWKLVRLVPAAYYTTELRWIGLVDLGLVFACLAAAVSLAMLLSRVVSRPIGEMAHAMERVGRRDFSATVPVRTRDELGTVAAGFNAMAGQLDRLFREAVSREREVQRATLRALRYQVNPHLLANTLASIRLTALAAGDGRAAGMLATLSRLLRRTLSQADDLVPLAAEIENLRDWIAVMQVRYLDRIDVRIEVDARFARRLVPPMVLQPLVENAVLHGLSARLNEEDGGAELEVTAADREGTLVLSVRDNGRGMSPDEVAAAFARDPEAAGPDGAGAIGIANVHARVRAQFGASAGLAIASTPGRGTTAVITLPSTGDAE
jgi:two-component system, sensor histidine kinase YesM